MPDSSKYVKGGATDSSKHVKMAENTRLVTDEDIRDPIKHKNYSKKTMPQITSTGEVAVLKLIKKHNKDLEDKEMIDSCLQKHFFLKALDKTARYT